MDTGRNQAAIMTDQPKPAASSVLKNYNFKLLWIGQGTSLLGDQFFMIALPWLVLKLTDDPLALGVVLALIGIPRALFMLVGGAVTDRYSPRAVMLISDILRLILTSLLTLMILEGWLQIWVLYVMAFIFGVISGFFSPASGAIMPLVVRSDELVIGNSIYQGTAYLTNFIGPMLAGGLIALFAHRTMAQGNAEMIGIAVAMAIDALTFLVSVVTLILMRWQGIQKPQVKASGNMLASIREGIKFLWRDDLLRTMFLLMVAANFLFAGPLLVGIPVLADSRLQGGAAAYGILMGAYGGGNLLGILMTNYVLKVIGRRMAAFIVGVIASFGVGLILMGVVGTTSVAFLILFTLGIGNGVLAITLITFIQRQSPKEMLGRVMSLVMLAAVGLVPVSQALTGMLIKMNLTGLFAVTGILMLLIAIWLAVQPVMRTIGQVLEAEVETAQV
jgi:MFS family permease